MEESHVDTLCTLGVAVHLVCGQDLVEVLPILFLLLLADRGRLEPGVIPASGHAGDRAEFFYRQGAGGQLCLLDDFKHTGRVMHNDRTEFVVLVIEEVFFKSSAS